MKIGIDIRNIGKNRTGDEVVFLNLTKNLAIIDQKNEYHLFTDIADSKTLKKIKEDLKIENKSNFKIISLPAKNKFCWNFWILAKYLRKNPVDIYLTQYIAPFFVNKKIKIFTIIHDISFNFYPQFIKFTDLFFLKLLLPLSFKRADKIIGVSRFTQDEIIKYYKIDPRKVSFIHNAASDDFLAQEISPEKIEKVRQKYGLPKNYILYIGTLQPRKNLPALVESMVLLKSQGILDIKLVIAGGKGHNYDRKIGEAVEKNKLSSDIFFPGFIDEKDKAAMMKGAQIFVYPSFYEGFGIPILEAMKLEIPVIASDIAPHREIARNAALFFNPQVPGELANELAKIIKNQTIKISLVAGGIIQAKKFSWERAAQKMFEMFRS